MKVYWWSVPVLFYWIPLATAVRFFGMPDSVDVGQEVQLMVHMDKGDNSNPFDIVILKEKARINVLRRIDNVTFQFSTNVTIPSIPQGLYTLVATEPNSSIPFSRNPTTFYVRSNSTSMPESTTATTQSLSSPSATEMPSSPSPSLSTVAVKSNEQHTNTLVIIGAVCGVLIPTVIVLFVVLFVVLYRRQRRLRTLFIEPPSYASTEPPLSPPVPYTIGYPPHPPGSVEQALSSTSDASTSKVDLTSGEAAFTFGYQPTEKGAKIQANTRTVRNWSDDPPPEYAQPV